MTTPDRSRERSLAEGVLAVLSIVQGRQRIEPVHDEVLAAWWVASDEDIEGALRPGSGVPFRVRRQLSFLFAERAAYTARENDSVEHLRFALRALVDGCSLVAWSNEVPTEGRRAAHAAALRLLASTLRHPLGRQLRKTIEQGDPGMASDRTGLELAVGLEWAEFDDAVNEIHRCLVSHDPARNLETTYEFEAAELLATSYHLPAEGLERPHYDQSDGSRRVAGVELVGFRGAPSALAADFTRRGTPVSALVLGDNGSGKSTLVDAIEFGLQGRLGRSVNFDSPLGPAAASLAHVDGAEPSVKVTLDDGTMVERQLLRREDGHLAEHGDPPRPGFRLAPVTLKRQDILRFLDTDALSRGHGFFDYFPADAQRMAVRPEELLQRLVDDAYRLRIAKADLVTKLSAITGIQESGLATREEVIRNVGDLYFNGDKLHVAQKDGRWDTLDESVRSATERLLGVHAELSRIKKRQQKGVEPLNPMAYRDQARVISSVLDGVGDELTLAFREITRATHVESISVRFGASGPVSLDVVVQLSSGRYCFPQQVFSEGYRDLLAVLFFALLARRAAESGQARVLILDDVFQSVDSTVRNATVDYLLRKFPDWQLIFTVHDRLWFEQLRLAFSRHNHPFVEREFRQWSFASGPVLAIPADLTATLRRELEVGEPSGICATAGRLLEQACDQLSWRLQSSVTRRREDKYTLGDLWPGIRKALKATTVADVCSEVDELVGLRNLAGAHYNEWADALSREEAARFGQAVLDFVTSTWCVECHDWVSRAGQDVKCRGGHVQV